ncbi:MAG: hypothetical protein LBL99_01590 [Holosporaceae bacterium]|jgi:hypothetical protein|nr:hypothetical protein [Holosporaceae bacterium]
MFKKAKIAAFLIGCFTASGATASTVITGVLPEYVGYQEHDSHIMSVSPADYRGNQLDSRPSAEYNWEINGRSSALPEVVHVLYQYAFPDEDTLNPAYLGAQLQQLFVPAENPNAVGFSIEIFPIDGSDVERRGFLEHIASWAAGRF